EELRHLRDGLWGVVAIRHEDVQETGLASHHADVPREFDEDRRLVVRVREALASLLEGHADDVLRLNLDAVHLAALGDVCVLAVRHGKEIRGVAVVLFDFQVVHGTDVRLLADVHDGYQEVLLHRRGFLQSLGGEEGQPTHAIERLHVGLDYRLWCGCRCSWYRDEVTGLQPVGSNLSQLAFRPGTEQGMIWGASQRRKTSDANFKDLPCIEMLKGLGDDSPAIPVRQRALPPEESNFRILGRRTCGKHRLNR